MAKAETESKCVAVCRSCDDVFAAMIRVDGSVRPIGVAGCSCGEESYHRLGSRGPGPAEP